MVKTKTEKHNFGAIKANTMGSTKIVEKLQLWY